MDKVANIIAENYIVAPMFLPVGNMRLLVSTLLPGI